MTASRRSPARAGTDPDRDRVVVAAVALVREQGLDALRLRAVAARLDTEPAELHRHIDGRRDLLREMLETVAAGIDVPPVQPDPEAEIVAIVRAVREVLRADPWAVRLLTLHRLVPRAVMPLAERIYAALELLGLDPPAMVAADGLIWQYVYGEVLTTVPGHGSRPDAVIRIAEAEPGTRIAALGPHMARTPDEMFDAGLGTILRGLRRT